VNINKSNVAAVRFSAEDKHLINAYGRKVWSLAFAQDMFYSCAGECVINHYVDQQCHCCHFLPSVL